MATQTNHVEMSEDEWWETFKPIKNHLDNNASADGYAFETYGAEVEYVISQIDNKTVWTVMEGDDGSAWIVEGYRLVNRIFYFITEKPWEDNTTYDICYWESMDATRDDCLECGEFFGEETGLKNIDGEGFCQTCRVELGFDEDDEGTDL